MAQDIEVDTLTHLEERIQKAVALVHRLRQEKEALLKELEAVRAELDDSRSGSATLKGELDALQAERRQVRGRIEKLLGHIDQLGAA